MRPAIYYLSIYLKDNKSRCRDRTFPCLLTLLTNTKIQSALTLITHEQIKEYTVCTHSEPDSVIKNEAMLCTENLAGARDYV